MWGTKPNSKHVPSLFFIPIGSARFAHISVPRYISLTLMTFERNISYLLFAYWHHVARFSTQFEITLVFISPFQKRNYRPLRQDV